MAAAETKLEANRSRYSVDVARDSEAKVEREVRWSDGQVHESLFLPQR